MENATKALLIAAGVIIGVILISLFTYLYSSTTSLQSSYETNLETNRINQINTKFLKYNGREDITAQEIVTIYNLAQEYQETDGINIVVEVKFLDGSIESNFDANWIKDHSTENVTGVINIKRYKATVTLQNGLVNKVTFGE